MNPVLAEVLLEAEKRGLTLLLDSVAIVVKDVIDGKDIAAAFNDLAMTLAEKQAVALDSILSPA